MEQFILEITDPQTQILEIETSFIECANNIEIERFDSFNLEIINTEKILWSDLPDNIPMSKISGNLHYTRIDGLDEYLDEYISGGNVHVDNLIWGISNTGLYGYLDQYYFDCGSPSSSSNNE